MAGQHHSAIFALYVPKSSEKNVELLWCVLRMYAYARFRLTALGRVFLSHLRWGCFFMFVSECVEIGVCLRNRVHNLVAVTRAPEYV